MKLSGWLSIEASNPSAAAITAVAGIKWITTYFITKCGRCKANPADCRGITNVQKVSARLTGYCSSLENVHKNDWPLQSFMRTTPNILSLAFSMGITSPSFVGGPPTKNAISSSKSTNFDGQNVGSAAKETCYSGMMINWVKSIYAFYVSSEIPRLVFTDSRDQVFLGFFAVLEWTASASKREG